MPSSSLASRYARALSEVVLDKAELERTAGHLEAVAELYMGSKDLRDFLRNPACPHEAKKKALEKIVQHLELAAPTKRLLEILLARGRVDLVPDLAREFRKIEEASLSRVAVELTTASALDPSTQKKVQASLEEFTGKKVRLTLVVDPSVLGGARARIGDRVYDGTLLHRMEKLKQQLIGER